MSLMKVAAMAALFALFCVGGAVEKIDIGLMLTGLDVPPQLKQVIGSMQAQIDDDRKHFQNQIETERKEKEALRADLQGQIDNEKKDKVRLRAEVQ
jgi:Skp family chaperone for outer membrane proteins